jgi:hypothetical protein
MKNEYVQFSLVKVITSKYQPVVPNINSDIPFETFNTLITMWNIMYKKHNILHFSITISHSVGRVAQSV